jgi:hypothetical protein
MQIMNGTRPVRSDPPPDQLARRNVMRIGKRQIMLGWMAALSMASSAAFAQGGGNGQGGSGGGNAHSAATAGMTHWGDPAPSPLDTTPGNTMKKMDSMEGGMQPRSSGDSMNAEKTGQ